MAEVSFIELFSFITSQYNFLTEVIDQTISGTAAPTFQKNVTQSAVEFGGADCGAGTPN